MKKVIARKKSKSQVQTAEPKRRRKKHAKKEVLPGDAASYDGNDVFEYEEAPKKGLPAVSIFVGLKLRLSLVGNTHLSQSCLIAQTASKG